jgi:hypothetical protein
MLKYFQIVWYAENSRKLEQQAWQGIVCKSLEVRPDYPKAFREFLAVVHIV